MPCKIFIFLHFTLFLDPIFVYTESMNNRVLKTLEYQKIIERLVAHASSNRGRDLCKRLVPMTEKSAIEASLTQTNDALTRIYRSGNLTFDGISDIYASIRRMEIGSTLHCAELLQIAALLNVALRVKSYAKNNREEEREDSLTSLFASVEPLSNIRAEITRCIIADDEYADDASSALSSFRRSMRHINDRIHAQLSAMISNTVMRTNLSDAIITSRNGRYCLPVKAEAKSLVPGIVHDQSSSGSTLFIEPMAVVNLGNELRSLQVKEEEEITVILSNLTNLVSEQKDLIITDYEVITELDFIFAKASLAAEYNGSVPIFNKERRIRIRQGRHPLLDSKSVVPIDIRLGDDFDQLVITGPNTGGKTVSLKTVGLLSLMGQAGLLIPAADRSELSVFTEIYADIGDEQSIEQSLSTFSSHMKNIVHILKHADSNSLVLFDELCAGTDPTEGAALAISILSRLHTNGIRTMATTHYSEIKIFALSTPGIENACCEFDVASLSPTYRLLIGIPGKSNAFAISGKLGLPSELIEDAKGRITKNEQEFEDLIAKLESGRRALEKEQEEIRQAKEEIKKIQSQTEEKQIKLNESREKILSDARLQAMDILQEAKDVADTSIRNFNKYGKTDVSASELEKERTKIRDKISDTQKRTSITQKHAATNHHAPKKLRIGDSVKVLSLNLKGTVHTLPNAKGDLFVQMGILRSQVNINDLVLLPDDTSPNPKQYAKTSQGALKMSKTATVSAEINLIGKTSDEAIAELDKYLDDAYLAHLPSVRIVHGKGTGALRKAVHAHLKNLRYIESYRLGEFGEGDAGVTIAEFK